MERFEFGDTHSDYYAFIYLWEPDNDQELHRATEFICAYGRGNEMLHDLTDRIQVICNNLGLPIVHEYNATNEPSLRLMERNNSQLCYNFIGDKYVDGQVWYVFEKTYYPQTEI